MELTLAYRKQSFEAFQLPAAILRPLGVLAWVAAGVLVLVTVLLALVGYLSAWWLEIRHRRLPSRRECVRRPPGTWVDGRTPLPDTAAAGGSWLDVARTP